MKGLKKRYLLILLFPFAYLLNYISLNNSQLTEKYYSTGIYRVISYITGHLIGWIPFSLAELLLPILAVIVLMRIVLLVKKLFTRKERRLHLLRDAVLNVLLVLSIAYFAFITMWGLNYNRSSLARIMNVEIKPSKTSELIALNEELLKTTNELRAGIEENDDSVMVPFGGYRDAFKRGKEGYLEAAKVYPVFKDINSRPKPLMFSSAIAYTNIWGIYSPFTAESNVNMMIPTPMLLSTMMHELAHQLGFAREDEANYIAYLTCSLHPDVDFRYSGALFALSYTMNSLYSQDREAYTDIYNRMDDGVKRDLAENSKYQKRYDGPVNKAFSKSNDIYLKANNQKDGERSYGRMVDLLLAQYRAKGKQESGQ